MIERLAAVLRALGNAGAVTNARRELHRLDDAIAHIEALAVSLALVEAPPPSVEQAA